jgi:hypothetical protein
MAGVRAQLPARELPARKRDSGSLLCVSGGTGSRPPGLDLFLLVHFQTRPASKKPGGPKASGAIPSKQPMDTPSRAPANLAAASAGAVAPSARKATGSGGAAGRPGKRRQQRQARPRARPGTYSLRSPGPAAACSAWAASCPARRAPCLPAPAPAARRSHPPRPPPGCPGPPTPGS